jgi:hypothetical protein
MFFHSHLMSELAETRAAEHHDAASRARKAAEAQQEPPSTASNPLDAYPRLCGFPVTIERVAVNGAAPDRRVTRLGFRPMPRRWLRARDD